MNRDELSLKPLEWFIFLCALVTLIGLSVSDARQFMHDQSTHFRGEIASNASNYR